MAGVAAASTALPTAIFHGLGDACKNSGMKNFTKEIADGTGAYAACLEVGNGAETSILTNMHKQAEMACAKVNEDKNFAGDFNVVGLSQGGLLARSIVE